MILDTEAIAEGICNHAAGSTIEVFVDMLDTIIDRGNGGVISDAWYYRHNDGDDDDATDDNEQADQYLEINDCLIELRQAIVQREKDNEEETTFGEEQS